MYRVYKCYYLLKFKASGYIAPQCREIFQTFVVRVTKLPHTKQTSVTFEMLRSYNIFVGFVQITLKPGKVTDFNHLDQHQFSPDNISRSPSVKVID